MARGTDQLRRRIRTQRSRVEWLSAHRDASTRVRKAEHVERSVSVRGTVTKPTQSRGRVTRSPSLGDLCAPLQVRRCKGQPRSGRILRCDGHREWLRMDHHGSGFQPLFRIEMAASVAELNQFIGTRIAVAPRDPPDESLLHKREMEPAQPGVVRAVHRKGDAAVSLKHRGFTPSASSHGIQNFLRHRVDLLHHVRRQREIRRRQNLGQLRGTGRADDCRSDEVVLFAPRGCKRHD